MSTKRSFVTKLRLVLLVEVSIYCEQRASVAGKGRWCGQPYTQVFCLIHPTDWHGNMIIMYDSIIILIPAKNEVNTVGQVVAQIIQRFPVTVMVIDDASTDQTAQVARTAGAKVLSLPCSLGAWGAIQTGLRYALTHNFQIAITMDADGQHEIDSISDLLAPIQAGQSEVVIGACPQRGSLLRHFAWSLFRKLSGIVLKDLTSGLRAYSQPAITLLASPVATLLEYQDLGVLILLHQAGLRVQEVPTLMYPRRNGHSRIFNTWWAVGSYMLHTGILCLAHQSKRVHQITKSN